MNNEISSKLPKWWRIPLFSLKIFILALVAVFQLSAYFRADVTVTATGRHRLDFRVFYLENNIFNENPIPQHLGFLMSYTDYIEVDNSFSANFSQEVDIYYSYYAEKRLVIRYIESADANLNRIVFEEVFPLSFTSGVIMADRIHFGTEDDGNPGGTYRILPKEHIWTYLYFIYEQARKMEAENVIARGLRGFSAELWIDFTHKINVPEFDLDEILTQGYRISLSTEVYSFVVTGAPNFEWEGNLVTQDVEITLPMIILFTALFTWSVFGLLYSIKMQMADSNKHQRKANEILKKYHHEIVVYDRPVDLTRYIHMVVQDFSELLKLAINLNKHIMCYRDERRTEFVVIVDEYACSYVIEYEKNDSELRSIRESEVLEH